MTTPIMPAHSKNIERYTPAWVGEALDTTFDLDPASPDCDYPMRKWVGRSYALGRGEDGLTLPWTNEDGTKAYVWLNPPWTRGAKTLWIKKLFEHAHGIALVRGGVDGKWFQDNPPTALILIRGRVQYVRGDGEGEKHRKGGAKGGLEPSMLLAYGEKARRDLIHSDVRGMFCEVVRG